MTDPTDEHVLGDLPELPDHVWAAALDHAFDPQAEPDVDLVPTDDLTGVDTDDDLSALGLVDAEDDPLDAVHDPFDHPYDSSDTSHFDYTSDTEHGYDHPGFSDTDGYF